MSDEPDDDQTDDTKGGGRKMDDELRDLGAIIRLLEGQDDDSRARRMMAYLADRYKVQP